MRRMFRFSKESKERVKHFGEELEKTMLPPKTEAEPAAEEVTPAEELAAAGAAAEDIALEQQTADAAAENTAESTDETTAEKADAAKETAADAADGVAIKVETNIGMVRLSNQDTVIEGKGLIGVADGMGGHNGGETASAMTREVLLTLLKDREPSGVALANVIRTVNRRVHAAADAHPNLSGMGTTLTALWAGSTQMIIGHVGDSRCYLLRDGELKQMTDDHSLVMDLVRSGMLTKEQAAIHPMRNIITRAIGTDEELEPDIVTVDRQKGDLWLICSDGLHGMITEEQIQELLDADDLQKTAEKLIEAALMAGGRDNVSVALMNDLEGAV